MAAPTSIRFPAHLREQVAERASAERRTFSNEVLLLVETALAAGGDPPEGRARVHEAVGRDLRRGRGRFVSGVARRGNGAGRGGAARGYSWPPFAEGNEMAVTHGAYARLKLAPRAVKIADGLREVVPASSTADGVTIDALSLVLAQLERAHLVLATLQTREVERVQSGGRLESGERDDLRRLAQDARAWANVALRYLETLGLSPTSRARLGVDVARIGDALWISRRRVVGCGLPPRRLSGEHSA